VGDSDAKSDRPVQRHSPPSGPDASGSGCGPGWADGGADVYAGNLEPATAMAGGVRLNLGQPDASEAVFGRRLNPLGPWRQRLHPRADREIRTRSFAGHFIEGHGL